MSLEFVDSFDHYNNLTNLQRKWDATSATSGFTTGRFGGNAIQIFNAFGPIKTLTSQVTRSMGFAWNCQGLPAVNTVIAQMLDSGTVQVDLRITTTGGVQVTRAGTVLGTSSVSTPFVANTWYYIEWQATIDPAAGAYTVVVTFGGNRTTWLSGAGVNTRNTANSSSNQVQLASASNTITSNFDDVYVLNSLGTVNNAMLGECRVLMSLPNADSAVNLQWTPNPGTTHYTNVNESSPNDDTNYNSSLTPGQLDTYKYPSISPTGAIAGVQVTLCERKDDAGARTTAVEYRSGSGTNYAGATNFSPGSNYSMDRQIYETDPATSAAWLPANVNAGEFGINCIA